MHFASYNSNYVKDQDYTEETVDGKTVIRFVDVYQLDAAATYGIRFSVKIPSTATVGDQTVAIEAKVAKDKTTENTETLLPAADITVTAGKITVTPDCEHTNATYSYSVVGDNCVTKSVCPDCDNEETIATIANKTITPIMVIASGLAVRYRVKKDAVTDYTNIYALISKDTYNSSTNALIGESTPENITAVTQGTNWQFEYKGIASYEMTCTIHVKVFGTDADGHVVLLASSDTAFADYLKTRLADTSGTYTNAYMNFYADALRYGAASQQYNGYRTDALATAGVTTTYGTALPTTFSNTVNTSTGSITITPNVVLSNSILFRIRFSQSEVSEYYTSGSLKMTIDYTDAYGNPQTAVANVSDFTSATNGRNWQYEFSDLPAAFVGDYFVIRLLDGDNELASLQYSFQSYAADRYNSYNGSSNELYAKLSVLCQATVAYSSSLKTALTGN